MESLGQRQGCLWSNRVMSPLLSMMDFNSYSYLLRTPDWFHCTSQYWVSSQKCTNIWWKTIFHWWLKLLINECEECFLLWVLPGFVAFVNCLISFGIIFMVLFFFLFLITVISYLLKPQTSIYINSLPVFKIITFCLSHIKCLFSSVLPLSRLKKFWCLDVLNFIQYKILIISSWSNEIPLLFF